MSQVNLIKISEFQINDYGLLLISETDGLPFLAVNEKGVVFDAGPFTGAFCSLEGLAKFFIVTDESKDAFSLQLMFAEGDVYPMGKAQFTVQYNDALRWVIKTNKKIAKKKGNEKEFSTLLAEEVIRMIAECMGEKEESLKPSTLLKDVVDSLGAEELKLELENRLSIRAPGDSIFPIRKIANIIDFMNAHFKDKTDLQNRLRGKTKDRHKAKHFRTL